MEVDYPAGHSMDTAFFAVDRDGHVGYFSSGEAGAVPVQAGEAGSLATEQLARLPRGEVVHDLQGQSRPNRLHPGGLHRAFSGHSYPFLSFLRSLDPVQEEIAAGRAVVAQASEGRAVIFRGMSEALVRKIHDGGDCLGCFFFFTDEDIEDSVGDLATRGFFVYDHTTENWISGPYGRTRRPVRPLHVDQLPPAVRNAVREIRFDALCFADAVYVQPIEYTPCDSWEVAYLDSTGTKIRPIPGKEKEYAHAYDQLKHLHSVEKDRIDVEPPRHTPDAGE
jgi:hypothetical protein